ncbi:hypothetical protein [Methanoculleus sp.]
MPGEARLIFRSRQQMMRAWTGANRYFTAAPDGWIGIACGRL